MSEDKLIWQDMHVRRLYLDGDGDFQSDGIVYGPETDDEKDECIGNLADALGRPVVPMAEVKALLAQVEALSAESVRLKTAVAPVEQYPWAIGTTYQGEPIAAVDKVPVSWEATPLLSRYTALPDKWREPFECETGHVVACRPVQAPATERVPAWEARGRVLPDGHKVSSGVQRYSDGSWFVVASGSVSDADADGMVEVLPLDGEA